MPSLFRAYEFRVSDTDLKETGVVEEYLAEDRKAAVAACAYTHGLKNGATRISPAGWVVIVGELQYAVVPAISGRRP